VPDLVGLSLDEAEEKLGERGLEDYVYAEHKVIIRSNWTVCSQVPGPDEAPAAAVDLYVEHFSCDGDD
jgi:beta-lactam-binding protein with PASTA domain